MFRKKSKKTVVVLMVLLITLVMVVTPVSAASTKLTLLSAVVKELRGGLEVTFKIDGDGEKFSGYVSYSGQQFKLKCHPKANNADLLVCRGADRGLESLAGKYIHVVVNGQSFYTTVRHFEFCYGVYDYLDSPDFPNWWMVDFNCYDQQPDLGEFETIDTPTIGTWTYFFGEGGFCPPGEYNDFGLGWYYPICITPF